VVHKHGKSTALRFQSSRRWRSPDSLLLPIGEALARMLAEEDLSDVKACEGATCTLMFADRTRGHFGERHRLMSLPSAAGSAMLGELCEQMRKVFL
jgi:predicted RNA-binding Zn ribbon-like protein